MPIVYVIKEDLLKIIGKDLTDEDFCNICFEFGLEVETTTTKEMPHRDIAEGEEEKPVYKIEVCANRYDLLCVEGIGRTLNSYLNNAPAPQFVIKNRAELETMTILPNTAKIRPYAFAAILRNIKFTPANYNSFISLQDKLHQNVARKRTLVAIGTHDYDTLEGPFTYDALPPKDIKFKALGEEEERTAAELMALYSDPKNEKYAKLREFVPIISWSQVYPVIYDKNKTILSMPPIINGEHSKIKLSTKNVFIEITCTDVTRGKIVLNTMVSMFSEYCFDKFSIEQVKIIRKTEEEKEESKSEDQIEEIIQSPDLACWDLDLEVDYVKALTGIEELNALQVKDLLVKMGLESNVKTEQSLVVRIPVTRSDILHACDLAEDVAIAYGINKIKLRIPKTHHIGRQLPLSQYTEKFRQLLAQAGYTECVTLSLLSIQDQFEKLRVDYEENQEKLVLISNPKTNEYKTCRMSLLPCLLKVFEANKEAPLPLKLFEINDVVMTDPHTHTGTCNQRRLCVLYANKTSGFEIIHGILDYVMAKFNIPNSEQHGYHIKKSNNGTFFEGMQVDVFYKEHHIGNMGILHPEVIFAFHLRFPISALELNLEFIINQNKQKH